jgi:parallel beta-helix repeat protein
MALDRKQKCSITAIFALILSAVSGAGLINLGFSTYVPWVWHNSGIFIQGDGSIQPVDAPIERLGNQYLLTNDIYGGGLSVQRSNCIIEGNGHKLLGSYYGTGLLLQNASNIIIQNINVQYFGQGIYLDNSNNSIIKSSSIDGCGISTFQSSNNQITGNTVGGDISIEYSINNTLNQNTASSISTSWSTNIIIRNNQISDAKRIDTQLTNANYTEGIYIDNSANTNVIGNIVERKNVGIDIWQSENTTLNGNTLSNNQVGFKLWGSDLQHNTQNIDNSNSVNGKPVYFLVNIANYQVPNNAGWIAAINCKNITVQNWISTPNWDGILFVDTQNSQIINSILSNNYNAIRFDQVSNSNITQNTINNNQHAAFYFEQTTNCAVTKNELFNNYFLFNILQKSTHNTLWNNDFLGNATGILGSDSTNAWNNSVGGNYWSAFTGVDLNNDKISDIPYLIDLNSNTTDNLPLMSPINNQTVVKQNPQSQAGPIFAMPEEYINYTITQINGAIWAKIDGTYPIHYSGDQTKDLPMVYPIPPNTTNIQVSINGAPLNWSNYDSIDPTAKHHTAIGDWQMINCLISPVPSDFLLEIHYEYPVQIINGSYTFLYDLNISPYLSPSSVRSIAYFTVQWQELPTNASRLTVFTTGSDSNWTKLNGLTIDGSTNSTAAFKIVSEYNKILPGDVAMVLSDSTIPEFPTWIICPLILTVSIGIGFLFKKKSERKS